MVAFFCKPHVALLEQTKNDLPSTFVSLPSVMVYTSSRSISCKAALFGRWQKTRSTQGEESPSLIDGECETRTLSTPVRPSSLYAVHTQKSRTQSLNANQATLPNALIHFLLFFCTLRPLSSPRKRFRGTCK